MARRDEDQDRQTRLVTAPSEPADRLLHLLSSFSMLRQNGKVLVNQIRGSIDEMRELRNRIRNQQPISFSAGSNGKPDRHGELRHRYGLTQRETEVAFLLAQGRRNSDIAQQLSISAHTARHHTQRILSKLEVHSRAAAGAKLRQ